ncbi:hypothetical protein PG991_008127 [Apiospora marii]|uniref:Zn(2)-C6 fungal-type domain-containing protein n=1 Tax=Apiospora marii TaxID=335849 RepID=A0ABR1RVT4_9PEZI
MSDWRPCRPSNESGDADQAVAERQDLGATPPVALEIPYILEPQLQSQSPSMISPILQEDTQQSDGQPYQAEGPYTCSRLPTADAIQEDHLSDDWMESINMPNLESANQQLSDSISYPQDPVQLTRPAIYINGEGSLIGPGSDLLDIRENIAFENSTSNDDVSDTLTNATRYDVSPSQQYQVDGDIQVLDQKIDDLLGLAQNTDINLLENAPFSGMLQNINTCSATPQSSSSEHLNHNLGLLAPRDPAPDLWWPSSTNPELFITHREFAMPAPIGPSVARTTQQSERQINLIPIRPNPAIVLANIPCGPSFRHIGPKSMEEVRERSLSDSQMETRKRRWEACSSPAPSCGDLLIVEQLTREFPLPNPKRTRCPYSKKTCLRCREYREKCTGGIPCHNCRSLWNKPRQRNSLMWTACFSSDLRELGYLLELMADITDEFSILAPQKLVNKLNDTLVTLIQDTTNDFLEDILLTGLPVQGLLGSALEVPEDYCISGCIHTLSAFYAFHMHPRYMAELTDLNHIAVMIIAAGLTLGCLRNIYKQLQRIKSGKPVEPGLPLVNVIEIVLIVIRAPTNQAAGILETAASRLFDEETERGQQARDSLAEELKNAAMRREDQRKHLMLYLDWCLNKLKGIKRCNWVHSTISQLQGLSYDWHPAGPTGRVTQQLVEEDGNVFA